MPILYMLIGLSGSGKSTWADKKVASRPAGSIVHLSSDAIRGELWGDENDQQNPAKVFNLMLKRTRLALNNGQDVIYDATNLKRKNRMHVVETVRKTIHQALFVEYVIFNRPVSECIQNDAHRARTVGTSVIERQYRQFQFPTDNEGYDHLCMAFSRHADEAAMIERIIDFGSQHNPHHTESLYEHSLQCKIHMHSKIRADVSCDIHVAALFHDYGKCFTQTFDENGVAHYYCHENISAYEAMFVLPPYYCAVIGLHMLPFTTTTRPKYVSEGMWADVMLLHECDVAASKPAREQDSV